jgi:hypothetical protein
LIGLTNSTLLATFNRVIKSLKFMWSTRWCHTSRRGFLTINALSYEFEQSKWRDCSNE